MNSSPLNALSSDALALLRKHNLLKELVSAEVIKDAVGGIEIPENDQKQLLDAYRKQHGIQSDEALQAHLEQRSLSESDLRWQLCLNKRIQIHSLEHFQHKAEARFLARKEQLDQVVYSLLRVKTPQIARELYLQIAGNEASFAELASRFSEGRERNTNGIVGPVPLTKAHPALAEKLRTNPAGRLLEPFSIGEWWLVARLERYEPARFEDAVAQQMALELFKEWEKVESAAKLRLLNGLPSDSAE